MTVTDTTSLAAQAIDKTARLANITEYQVFKVGKNGITTTEVTLKMGKMPILGLPEKPDKKTLVIFDDADQYIKDNGNSDQFKLKIKDIFNNYGKIVSIAPVGNQENFIRLMQGTTGERLANPAAYSTINGKVIQQDNPTSAIGLKIRPPDAVCTDSAQVSCGGIVAQFSAQAYKQDGTVDTELLNSLILRWMGDE